jgi:hypothetical protein
VAAFAGSLHHSAQRDWLEPGTRECRQQPRQYFQNDRRTIARKGSMAIVQ